MTKTAYTVIRPSGTPAKRKTVKKKAKMNKRVILNGIIVQKNKQTPPSTPPKASKIQKGCIEIDVSSDDESTPTTTMSGDTVATTPSPSQQRLDRDKFLKKLEQRQAKISNKKVEISTNYVVKAWQQS